MPSLDAIISAAGAARFKPLLSLTDEDFAFSLNSKLMGQVNLIRYGLLALKDGGSITITTGLLAQHPMVGSGAVSLVNAALEGFVRSAALEAPRGIRVNAVSPPWVRTAKENAAITASAGLPANAVAQAYVSILEGSYSGQIISP
jgi:NAD(P)-dependent dehydrogenase (short-subunit alcohol dehydrogenase family)